MTFPSDRPAPIRILGHTADGRLVVAVMTEPRWTIRLVPVARPAECAERREVA